MMFAPALHAKRAAAAILAAALPLLVIAAACATPEPQIIEREIIVREVVKEVEVVVTATPAPQPTPTPIPTAAPITTPTPRATATSAPARAETQRTAAKPTSTPKPSATPTLTVDDFYVIINQGHSSSDGFGKASLYYNAQNIESGNGAEMNFFNEDFVINYLLSQEIITPAQKNAYYTPVSPERTDDFINSRMAKVFDEEYPGNIKVPLQPFADAIYKLRTAQREGGPLSKMETFSEASFREIIHFASKHSLDSGTPISLRENVLVPSGDEGYVIINGNSVQTVMVDDQGNTTSVDVKVAGIEEVLDYWLSQNKITVEQRDQYGRTGAGGTFLQGRRGPLRLRLLGRRLPRGHRRRGRKHHTRQAAAPVHGAIVSTPKSSPAPHLAPPHPPCCARYTPPHCR